MDDNSSRICSSWASSPAVTAVSQRHPRTGGVLDAAALGRRQGAIPTPIENVQNGHEALDPLGR